MAQAAAILYQGHAQITVDSLSENAVVYWIKIGRKLLKKWSFHCAQVSKLVIVFPFDFLDS